MKETTSSGVEELLLLWSTDKGVHETELSVDTISEVAMRDIKGILPAIMPEIVAKDRNGFNASEHKFRCF